MNTTLPDSLGSSEDWLYSSACSSRSFLRTAKEFKVASKYLGADSSLAVIEGMQQVTMSTLKSVTKDDVVEREVVGS